VRSSVRVEMSGGIRDDESLSAALGTGAARVNIGTAALEHPEWCAKAIAEHGDRIAVGLDVRGRTLAARGWTREGGDLYDVLARLDSEGCARYVVTDVNKDGMLQGPNLELLRNLDRIVALGRPVMVGISRKWTLARVVSGPDARVGTDAASVGAAVAAFDRGATLFRVHDVRSHVEALAVAAAVERGGVAT